MKTTRQCLMGNFVSLYEVVKAVADCIMISDEEADRCRGPNRRRDESAFEVQIARSQMKSVMAQSRAAGVLLEPLNRPPGLRPDWYDASRKFPKLKDVVSDRGMDILIDLSEAEARLRRRDRYAQQSESLEGDPALLPAHSIGFEIEELISHLKSAHVPHSLKLHGAPIQGHLEPKPAPISSGDATPRIASQLPAAMKESESLTAYLSRTFPPPHIPPERIHEARLDIQLASSKDPDLVSARTDDAPSDDESSVDHEWEEHSVDASRVNDVMLQAAWQKFEAWARNSRSSPAKPIVLKVLKAFEPEDRKHFSFVDVRVAITELYLSGTSNELRSVGEVDGEWQFVCGTSKGAKPCTQSAVVQLLRRWKERHDLLLEGLVSELSTR